VSWIFLARRRCARGSSRIERRRQGRLQVLCVLPAGCAPPARHRLRVSRTYTWISGTTTRLFRIDSLLSLGTLRFFHSGAIPCQQPYLSTMSSSSLDNPPDVDSFMRELTGLEREGELTRVTTAFKMNPFDILNVVHTATKEEIAKAYRTASLLVHPDKFPAGEKRDKAQQAFTMLAAAKDELLDEAKREAIDTIVDQARQKVLTEKALESSSKKRKVDDSSSSSSTGAAYSSSSSSDSKVDATPNDASKDPRFDAWVRDQVKEILIEREWKKRQLLKAAAEQDVLAAAEKKRRTEEREAKEKETKAWEEGRDTRINSWRDFQNKKGKAKIGFRPPKSSTNDQANTYVKRPVVHESSEK
jgi:DnaJ family protein C protein 8